MFVWDFFITSLEKFNYKTFYFNYCVYYVPAKWLPYMDSALCKLGYIIDMFTSIFSNLLDIVAWGLNGGESFLKYSVNYLVPKAIITAVKFMLCIALLIFARGGIPRFRFDYLTKLGWIRFLSLVLAFFLLELFLLSL